MASDTPAPMEDIEQRLAVLKINESRFGPLKVKPPPPPVTIEWTYGPLEMQEQMASRTRLWLLGNEMKQIYGQLKDGGWYKNDKGHYVLWLISKPHNFDLDYFVADSNPRAFKDETQRKVVIQTVEPPMENEYFPAIWSRITFPREVISQTKAL